VKLAETVQVYFKQVEERDMPSREDNLQQLSEKFAAVHDDC
jgi:hypothetical protein